MPDHIPSRRRLSSSRLARRLSLALAATVALGLQGVVPASSASAADPCLSAGSSERLAHGSEAAEPNELSPQEVRAVERQLSERRQRARTSYEVRTVTVDVHVHVITAGDGETGRVPTEQIDQQIAVLNAAYGGQTSSGSSDTPFRFVLRTVDYTANDAWYDWAGGAAEDAESREAKATLRQGGRDDLNLYVASLQNEILGYATFPWEDPVEIDGIVVTNGALPGGSLELYDEGDTTTHEVGHWLGLYHTFQNGCFEPGDMVEDTPYQAAGDNIFSCAEADTCEQPGADPVRNFMGYGEDACIDEFTAGQAQRMTTVWDAYRAPSLQA